MEIIHKDAIIAQINNINNLYDVAISQLKNLYVVEVRKYFNGTLWNLLYKYIINPHEAICIDGNVISLLSRKSHRGSFNTIGTIEIIQYNDDTNQLVLKINDNEYINTSDRSNIYANIWSEYILDSIGNEHQEQAKKLIDSDKLTIAKKLVFK